MEPLKRWLDRLLVADVFVVTLGPFGFLPLCCVKPAASISP